MLDQDRLMAIEAQDKELARMLQERVSSFAVQCGEILDILEIVLVFRNGVPDGKTHNQIDHILIDRRMHSNVLVVRSFRAADCDSDHYPVVAKVRERLAVNKQRSQ
jgi:endonuclease/exonuclease/phosphatase family metal-dependent hydrolase